MINIYKEKIILNENSNKKILSIVSTQVRYNVSTNRTPPYFEVRGLPPGVSYRIDLYAVNAKGRSDVSTIETVTLKGQEKYTGKLQFSYAIDVFRENISQESLFVADVLLL